MILQEIPGLNVLGWGYDVFGRYASPESRMQPLFDFGEMTEIRPAKEEYTYLIPEIIKRFCAPYRYSEFEIHSGNSIEQYQSSLASKTCLKGSYGFYSGALEVGFSSSSLRITTMKYTNITQLITRWILQLPNPDDLKGMLRPEVKKDIDGDSEPNALFNKYGSYFLWNLIVGGRISYMSSTDSTKFKSTTDVSVAAEMSYQSLSGSISGSNKSTYQKSIDTFQKSSQTKTRARGGKAEYISAIKTSGIDQDNWQAWAASIEDSPEFVGFVDNKRQPSLRPIWDLCSQEDRRRQLAAAYEEYAKEQPGLVQAKLYPIYKHEAENPMRYTLSQIHDPVQAHGTGWSGGEIVFFAFKEREEGTEPIYQYEVKREKGWSFAYSSEEEFYSGWVPSHKNHENVVAFYAYTEPVSGTIPIYQAKAKDDDGYRFAYSTSDVGSVNGPGWVNDCEVFYAFSG